MWILLNKFHSCTCPEGLTCWTEGGKKDRVVQKQGKLGLGARKDFKKGKKFRTKRRAGGAEPKETYKQ